MGGKTMIKVRISSQLYNIEYKNQRRQFIEDYGELIKPPFNLKFLGEDAEEAEIDLNGLEDIPKLLEIIGSEMVVYAPYNDNDFYRILIYDDYIE